MASYITFPDGIKIQVTLTSITPGYSSEKTKHKIEKGSDITDHFVKNNITLALEGIVSEIDNNITTDEKNRIINDYINNKTLPQPKVNESVKIADELFLTAWENGDLLTIETSKRTYKNMSVVGYSCPETPQLGKSLRFTLSLEETRFATSKTQKKKYSQSKKSKVDNSKTNDENKKILEKLKKKYQDRVNKGKQQKTKILPKPTMRAKVLINGISGSTEDLLAYDRTIFNL